LEWYIIFLIALGGLLLLLFLGYWVPFALGTVGIIGIYLVKDGTSLGALGLIGWNSINSFELTAVPLFIFMGEIILRTGISDKFFENMSILIRRLPGGLLQTNIMSSGFFAAVSGSSTATIAAVGSVAVPELKKRGYNHSMIYGSLGGGGALGYLIPPSTALIIYGSLVQESVAKLFLAGILPGLIAITIFMFFIGIVCYIKPDMVPHQKSDTSLTLKQFIKSIIGIMPVVIMILMVLGGIYLGLTTPTESASLGAVISLFYAVIYRKFTYKNIKHSLVYTVKTTSMVMFIIFGAQILSHFIVESGINRALTDWIIELNPSPVLFLTIIVIIYLILGCIMDGLSMIFLTLPILFPLIQAMGFDAIWFGIVLVILIEIAQITPPVGVNLFVLQGISGKGTSLGKIVKGNIPYFFLYLLLLIIVMVFPKFVLWLPSTM